MRVVPSSGPAPGATKPAEPGTVPGEYDRIAQEADRQRPREPARRKRGAPEVERPATLGRPPHVPEAPPALDPMLREPFAALAPCRPPVGAVRPAVGEEPRDRRPLGERTAGVLAGTQAFPVPGPRTPPVSRAPAPDRPSPHRQGTEVAPPPPPPAEAEILVEQSGAEIRVERLEPETLRISDLPAALPEEEVDTLDLAEAQTGASSSHREFLPDAPAPHVIEEFVDVPFDLVEHAPLPEAIAVHVTDPRGDWRLDLSRTAEVVDLVVHAPADVRNLLTRAESELRASFQATGHTMGTMDFTEHQARREEAPEWPAPRRSARPRVTERVRQGRLLDRGA